MSAKEDAVIPLERKLCIVCAREYASGNPLLDGNLGEVFREHATFVMSNPCSECHKFIAKRFVGLVGFDPDKTKNINYENSTVDPYYVYRTGRLLWMPRACVSLLFPELAVEKVFTDGFAFVDKARIDAVIPYINQLKQQASLETEDKPDAEDSLE